VHGVAAEELEALRVPLAGYCYRLLASAADTEDAVQESLVRASMRIDQSTRREGACLPGFTGSQPTSVLTCSVPRAAGRSSWTWGRRRARANLGAPLPPRAWVEPMPDSSLLSAAPEDQVLARESVRLAFIAALQRLTPRQRAVLVLRDVLAFSARETAEILDTTQASVNSTLQRARAAMAAERPDPWQLADPEEADQRALLERYVAAFEAHDVAELTRLLREDAIASMPPFRWCLRGGAKIAELVGSSDSCAGARLVPCRFNGGVGFGQYRPTDDGRILPYAIVAVEVFGGQISQVVTFLGTEERFAEFGLPASIQEFSTAADELSPAASYQG
jgi:RNA polymerase sigma-70 factor (TIGR02960 family)